ncbi:MAG: hypothetical protein IKU25_05735 [Clostridia bacterium]|nr:hypothetical protein [Clostridia bacterium]
MKRVIVFLMIIAILFSFGACVKYDNNLDNYQSDVENNYAHWFMPELESLGNYTNIEYTCRKDESFFAEYSMQLVVEYDEDAFVTEKARLETAYEYLDKPLRTEYGEAGYYTIPVEKFSYAGFEFRVVKFDDTFYPKYFGILGICEEKQQVAYLWVYAIDLDYICELDEDPLEAMKEKMELWFDFE